MVTDTSAMHEEDLLEIWIETVSAVKWKQTLRERPGDRAAIEVLATLKHHDALEGLRAGAELVDRIEGQRLQMVERAVEQGATFGEIGAALNASEQSVLTEYGQDLESGMETSD